MHMVDQQWALFGRGGAGPLVATGTRPGWIPPWSESTSGLLDRSVGRGSLVTSEFVKICGLLTRCAGLGRGDPVRRKPGRTAQG